MDHVRGMIQRYYKGVATPLVQYCPGRVGDRNPGPLGEVLEPMLYQPPLQTWMVTTYPSRNLEDHGMLMNCTRTPGRRPQTN